MHHYHFNLAKGTATDLWNRFVAELRSDIMLYAPMKPHESEEPAENWFEFVKRMRFEIEHPDRELLALLADKDAKIAHLNEQVVALHQKLEKQQTKSIASDTEVPDNEACIYEQQLQQAQQFVNENSKADVSRIRDLLRKIMPVECYAEIDRIKEAKAFNHFEINGGSNQILPNAKIAIQR